MDDRSYYQQRTLQEQEAARKAACPEARERHAELAAAYALRSRFAEIVASDPVRSERTGRELVGAA
jgi:hypothetical protein